MLRDFLFRLRSLVRRTKVEAELEIELQFHFDRLVEKQVHAGKTRREAMRRARLILGGMDQVKEECRDARGVELLETTLQDVRYALRMLRQKPTFALVAILTLALGVGATTAIFSMVNAVLLRPLPFPNPDRLVKIVFSNPGAGSRDVPFSIPEVDDLRTRPGVFQDLVIAGRNSVTLTGGTQPERIWFLTSTPNYFSMLGTAPQIGRLIGQQDFALGFAPVVVISDGLWRRSFGADPKVLGRTLRLDNDPYKIIGVLPPGFRHPGPAASGQLEVWCTAGFSDDPAPKPKRSTRFLSTLIGRLKPGLTLEQAQARLNAMAIEVQRDFPADYSPEAKWAVRIQSLQESLVGNVRPMLLVLLGAVFVIVLLVGLNIANLLLARASGRQQEMAVRSALGASRARIVRQLLTESVLLSMIGGALGIATAVSALKLILRFVPPSIPRLDEVAVDWVVLLFALLVTLLTGMLFGVAPAILSTRSTLSVGMREGARGSGSGAKTGRLRDLLVVSELALAVVLLVGAGLLLRTVRDLLETNPGFNPTQVVTATVDLPVPNDPKADPYIGIGRETTFMQELLRRLDKIPGVALSGITSDLPATKQTARLGLALEDRPLESARDLSVEMIRISPNYLRAMQAGLVRGRFFSDSDQDGKPLVAIIDETTARRYWTDRDPVGRRLRLGPDPTLPWITVVGIVRDIKNDGLDIDGVPHIYVSTYQDPDRGIQLNRSADANRTLSLVLRTSLPASLLEPQIRREVQSIDPALPVSDVSSMDAVLDASIASRRFSAELVGGFAGVALGLASIGIYGLLAYMVGQRSREIGLRMALGAGRADIFKLIVTKGIVLACVGIVVGVLLAAASASVMASLLYGVRPHDATVFFVAPVLLLAVAALASYLPAWRASKVDPTVALREA
jgi:predicted permease